MSVNEDHVLSRLFSCEATNRVIGWRNPRLQFLSIARVGVRGSVVRILHGCERAEENHLYTHGLRVLDIGTECADDARDVRRLTERHEEIVRAFEQKQAARM